MTEIRAFQAVRYNKKKVQDLDKVVCPPYDVISEIQQQGYYNLSPHNFIRVLLAEQRPDDTKSENRYTRSRETYQEWMKNGILVQEDRPAIYYYRQEFKVMGTRCNRLGFIALMRTPDDANSKVYPHEKTHAAAKEDRFALWKKLDAALSPIFVCFSDKEKKIEKIFTNNVSKTDPEIDVLDAEGVRHIVWPVSDDCLIQEIVGTMADQPVFIADGHHRFEVSCQLKQLKKAHNSKHTGQENYNYVMTYFTNMDSRDLQIFPMHRIVKKFPQNVAFLEEYFRIDRMKTKEELLVLLAKAGQNEHAFGLYTREGMWLLRLKNKALIDKIVKEGSREYKNLDATILKYFVFDPVGIASDEIIYTKEINDVVCMVEEKQAEAGFLMNAVRMQQLKEIALNGERMPPKTTYFYPKLLSGLTVLTFD